MNLDGGAAASTSRGDGKYLTRKAGGREAFCTPNGHGTSLVKRVLSQLSLAQSVEHLTTDQEVAGSIPALHITKRKPSPGTMGKRPNARRRKANRAVVSSRNGGRLSWRSSAAEGLAIPLRSQTRGTPGAVRSGHPKWPGVAATTGRWWRRRETIIRAKDRYRAGAYSQPYAPSPTGGILPGIRACSSNW